MQDDDAATTMREVAEVLAGLLAQADAGDLAVTPQLRHAVQGARVALEAAADSTTAPPSGQQEGPPS